MNTKHLKHTGWGFVSIAAGCALLWLISPGGSPSLASAPDVEMVLVKGGCFQMGDSFGDGFDDEEPVHEVCIGDFYIGKYEVTQAEWQAVMGHNPSKFKGDRRPVESVSWEEAQAFIARLNQLTGKNYRFPTEAEWEYAARSGGKKEKWAGTSDPGRLGEYAWYSANSGKTTHEVGTRKPNGLGICDMGGNVWEWVDDYYEMTWYEKSAKDNPQGPPAGSHRILRGGSFGNPARGVRVTERGRSEPTSRDIAIGLRLATSSK
jgi:formylglycine-generating enzyme required for sulfatase activity